jgi:hypothetical protein
MSAKIIGLANILIVSLVMTLVSASAEARIVIEPKAGPAIAAPRTGQWLPSTQFQGSLLAPLIAVPLVCDVRSDPALRARTDRLFQQQHLAYTLARARFWRSQR